ncbi:MAG: hypothetical protein CMN30_17970 [Sandaracinus sp.]|nr:hypothetical protein [Sandaracinus sp.]|tara:strand:+ start:162 stop:788 length:627 start_codon:yes stop_codon:yes gene_type:complete
MSERDLDGRCGTCGFYMKLRTDEAGVGWGDCRLGCWPSPLRDTATCSSYKRIGESFDGALKRKKAAGTPRRYRDEDHEAPPPRKAIPQELGIDMDQDEFREVLREVLLDELGIRDVAIGDRWHGGELVMKPGRDGTQDKSIPLDIFFKKIVQVRDKLRVLEQKVNGHKGLSNEEKVQMQQYITACYGSLTTFNVLFKEKKDHFVGQKS